MSHDCGSLLYWDYINTVAVWEGEGCGWVSGQLHTFGASLLVWGGYTVAGFMLTLRTAYILCVVLVAV